jgi:RHS repeat-associated protein
MRRLSLKTTLILLVCLGIILGQMPSSAAVPPDPIGGYIPTGIPADALPADLPLDHVNLRFTPPTPTEMAPAIRQAVRAASTKVTSQAILITPEIQALADGLEGDPLLIFDYVHNNVDFVSSWGLVRNPRETLLAGTGNPFDQAALLAALLQAAGYSTRYAFGTIQIPKTQAMNWSGVTDGSVVLFAFLDGGISAWDVGSDLQIEHVWVQVQVGGTWYPLDPSFKTYTYQPTLSNLTGTLGYDREDFLAAANGTVTPGYAQGVDDSAIRDELTDYSNNLIAYLAANDPFAYTEDVIGGRQIVPETLSALPTSLPYTVLPGQVTSTELGDDFKYFVRVQLAGLDYEIPLADVAGERVTLFYTGTTPGDRQIIEDAGGIYNVYPAYQVSMSPQLRIGGQLVATGQGRKLGSRETITVIVTTPLADGGGGKLTFSFSQYVATGAWYALPIRAGGVSVGTLTRHYQLLQQNMDLPEEDEARLGQAQYTLGMSYFNQVDLSSRLDAQLGGIVEIPFFSVMLMSQDLAVESELVNDVWEPARVLPAGFTIDVQMNLNSWLSAAGDTAQEIAYTLFSGIKSSAAEHATHEQLQGISAVSTIRALALANAEGQKIYHVTEPSQLNELDYPQSILSLLKDYLDQGFELLIPMADVVQGSWIGVGWIAYDPGSGAAAYIISGSLAGGKAVEPVTINVNALFFKTLALALPVAAGLITDRNSFLPATVYPVTDPINALSGAFHQQEVGLTLDEDFRFVTTYSSSSAPRDGFLGHGWRHNFDLGLHVGSDWTRGLGTGTAADAAAAIAASYVGLDILKGAPPAFERLLIASIMGDWALDQLTDNSVVVQGDWGVASFLGLSNGSYVPSPGFDRRLQANAAGEYTLQDKTGATIHFNSQGRAMALIDANGNQTSLSYNIVGHLVRVAGPTGRGFDFWYDDKDHITHVADAADRSLLYTYDSSGNLTSYTNARGGVSAYTYDSQHHLQTVTDPEGIVVANNTYDALGRVTEQMNGRGVSTQLLYGGTRITLIDGEGYRTVYFRDTRGRLVGAEDALGCHTAATYDAHDNLVSYTDANGAVVFFTYDARANLTAVNHAGLTTTLRYDEADNLETLTDARGNTAFFTYDDRHNLLSITDAEGDAVTFTYDIEGHLIKLTDARGHETGYSYDPHSHLIAIEGPLADTTLIDYDAAGRPIAVIDPLGQTTRFAYDPNDNVTTVATPLGRQTAYSYDGNDNLVTVTDPGGFVTSFTYDAQFNLASVIDALGQTTDYTYNANDQLIEVENARGFRTTYDRDEQGRVTQVTDPLDQQTAFTYDCSDNLLALTKPSGTQISYVYDVLDRLTNITYSDSSTVTYAYDDIGNLTSASYDGWQATYTYDRVNRLASVTYPSLGRDVSYDYDDVGNLLNLTVNEGGNPIYEAVYTYDSTNRLIKLNAPLDGTTVDLAYDLLGNLTAMTFGSGASTNYTYDADDRPSEVEISTPGEGVIATFSYSYDAVGNPTSVTETTASEGTLIHSYTYEGGLRLIGESYPGYSATYGYDAGGNLVSFDDGSGVVIHTYDDADQLTSAGGMTYTYDPDGNRLHQISEGEVYTYTYDVENRLTGLSGSGGDWQFAYDAIGRRIQATGPGGQSNFLYDGLQLILEDGPAGQSDYMYAGPYLVARVGDLTNVSFHGDAIGHVRNLVNSGGSTTDAYRYTPYGRVALATGIDPNPYRFTGQWGVRAEPGQADLYWMGFRTYDATSARFLTHDPLPGVIDWPYSQNPYLYANANPVRFTDSCGLRSEVRLASYQLTSPLQTHPAMEGRYLPGNWAGLSPGVRNRLGRARTVLAFPLRAVRNLRNWLCRTGRIRCKN